MIEASIRRIIRRRRSRIIRQIRIIIMVLMLLRAGIRQMFRIIGMPMTIIQ